MRIRAWLALTVVLLLLFPASAAAVGGVKAPEATAAPPRALSFGSVDLLATDDDIPGVPIPASPFVGAVDAFTDPDDVYAITLAAGDSLQVSLSGPMGSDFDIYLIRNNTGSIADGYILASSSEVGSEEMFSWTAWSDETAYLDVYAYSGTGAYTLTWQIQPKAADDDVPGVPIPASPIDDFVDRGTDTADVFAVTLAAGELIEADLIGESGDFDLELYAPGTPSIWTGSTWVLEGSYGDYATESISHQATVAGTYYLVVTAYKGGDDYILIWSIDGETPDGPTVVPVAGTDRITTAIEASKLAYPLSADHVVIATGRNWPDALGGSALAGVLDAPILLTEPTALPAAVLSEIDRLGATHATILGGVGAVSAEVETALKAELGTAPGVVTRIAGDNRYATANAIASKVMTLLDSAYDGTVLIATGEDFPDALAAAPLAAANGWPLLLAHPSTGLSAASKATMEYAQNVLILGGTGVVSPATENYLQMTYGAPNVDRLFGANRYATAVAIASFGVTDAGLAWNGVGVATGENYPDALAGGVLQGNAGSVMLLTTSASLSSDTAAALTAHKSVIDTVTFFGGTGAVMPATRTAVVNALK